MAKPDVPKPTESELQILGVLWRRGPSTVREVHSDLAGPTGYTSVLKLMQIMTDKGLLVREISDSARAHIYRPAHSETLTQRKIVGDLLHRAFGGSARKLVAAALSSRRASPAELEEIRKLLEQYKKKGDAT
jgi:BlaI family transcriptional regulator, penicillinase repressor